MQNIGDLNQKTKEKKDKYSSQNQSEETEFKTLDLGQGISQQNPKSTSSGEFKTLDLGQGKNIRGNKQSSRHFHPNPGLLGANHFRTLDLGEKPKGNPEKKGPMFYHYLLNDYNAMKYYQTDIYDQDFIKLERYDDISKLKCAFPSTLKMNDPGFNLKKIKQARFFVLRSTCDDDIHKAIKYGIWTSTYKNNLILNDLYRKYRRDNIPIFLIYTVVGSGQYSGLAQMCSEVELKKTFSYWWEEVKWSGVFKINWIYVKDVLYEEVEDVLLPSGNKIISCKDGAELDFKTGYRMLEKFKYSVYVSDIFECFNFMDNREEKIRLKRDSMNRIIQSLKQKGLIPPVPPKMSKRKRRMERKKNKYLNKNEKPKPQFQTQGGFQQNPGFMNMPNYRGNFPYQGVNPMGGMMGHPSQMHRKMGGPMPFNMPMHPNMDMMRMGYPPNMRYMGFPHPGFRYDGKVSGMGSNFYHNNQNTGNKGSGSQEDTKANSNK